MTYKKDYIFLFHNEGGGIVKRYAQYIKKHTGLKKIENK